MLRAFRNGVKFAEPVQSNAAVPAAAEAHSAHGRPVTHMAHPFGSFALPTPTAIRWRRNPRIIVRELACPAPDGASRQPVRFSHTADRAAVSRHSEEPV